MRLLLVLEVEPIGKEPFREWPLHCTLVHWFDFSGSLEELKTRLAQLFNSFDPIILTGGEMAMFGEKQDVPVDLVKTSSGLQKLHNSTVALLASMNAKFTAEHFLRTGYRPHVTLHHNHRLGNGGQHTATGVYLVTYTDEASKERQVVTRFKLGEVQ